MKKRFSAVFLASIMIMLAACTQQQNGGNGVDTSATDNTTSIEESSASETSADTSAQQSDNATSESTTVASVPENDDSGTASEAERLTEIVLNAVEFPATVSLEDEGIISDTIGLNLDDLEEYCITQQMMSVHLVEVIIAKPKEGKTADVKEALEARRDALINTFAFYPDQVDSANATVVGEKGDYVYLICHTEAAAAEEKLLTEIQ